MATTTTLATIRTACYNTIKQPEDCAAYPYALIDIFINKAHTNIFGGTVTDIVSGQSLVKNNINFADKTAFFTSVMPTTLSATATVGATSVTVSSTLWYPTSWALWIEWDIITYTGTTSTSFTGIPTTWDGALSFAWTSGTRVFALYPLPSDFLQLTSVDYQSTPGGSLIRMVGVDYRDVKNQVLNQQLYRFFRADYSIANNQERYFTLVHGQYFLPFLPQSGYALRFEYQKTPTPLVLSSDISSIPDQYVLNTVPYLATGEMLFNRWESDEGMKLFKFGYLNVRDMYRFYNTQGKDLIYNQRIRTASDGFINI